jgi:hypothetical protein
MTSTRVSEIADRNYNDTENSSAPGFSSHAYSDAVSMVDSSKSRELAISLAPCVAHEIGRMLSRECTRPVALQQKSRPPAA